MKHTAVSFRDATTDDAEALRVLGRETFIETFGALYKPTDLHHFLGEMYGPEKQLEELNDPQNDVRLVVDELGHLMGYCMIGPVKLPIEHDPETSLELHRMYVRQRIQGVGIGGILLSWAMQQARDRGAKQMYIGVWESNHRAIGVYESRGFKIVGDYKFRVGTAYDDEKIMLGDL